MAGFLVGTDLGILVQKGRDRLLFGGKRGRDIDIGRG